MAFKRVPVISEEDEFKDSGYIKAGVQVEVALVLVDESYSFRKDAHNFTYMGPDFL